VAGKEKSKSKVTPGRTKKTREDWDKDVAKKRIKLDGKIKARAEAREKKKAPTSSTHKELKAEAKQLPALRAPGEPTEKELAKLERSKKSLAGLKGTFKKYVPESKMLIARQEVGSSGALVQRGFLMQLIDLIPVAEDAYRDYPSQSNAYALNTLISSAREVLAEIEAQNDGTQMSVSLVQEILMPSFQEIAQQIVLAIYALREQMLRLVTESKDRTAVDKHIDAIGGDIRQFLGDKFADMREKIVDRIHKG
jgi:hypothetical protein